jgi:putative flippase GtrA
LEVFDKREAVLRTILQGLKFGAVGGAATAVHVVAFILWIELAGLSPLWANVAAFCVAITVAFTGHFSWTFRHPDPTRQGPWRKTFAKFAAVALFGLAMNSLCVFLVVDLLAWPYLVAAALMATLVPACVFALSKFWVFA